MRRVTIRGRSPEEVPLADLVDLNEHLNEVKARLRWVAGEFDLGAQGASAVATEVVDDAAGDGTTLDDREDDTLDPIAVFDVDLMRHRQELRRGSGGRDRPPAGRAQVFRERSSRIVVTL